MPFQIETASFQPWSPATSSRPSTGLGDILQTPVTYAGVWSMSSVMSRPSDPSPPSLTTTSYAVLAQLTVHPWSTYELARQRVRYFRYVWPRAESAIYREVKRLAAMRLVAAKREFVGKRPRTVYSITEAGRQVLREWLA